MLQWIRCPPLLKWKLAGTLLVEIGSICIALVMFFLFQDRMLLVLSGLIFLGCLCQCESLWCTIIKAIPIS